MVSRLCTIKVISGSSWIQYLAVLYKESLKCYWNVIMTVVFCLLDRVSVEVEHRRMMIVCGERVANKRQFSNQVESLAEYWSSGSSIIVKTFLTISLVIQASTRHGRTWLPNKDTEDGFCKILNRAILLQYPEGLSYFNRKHDRPIECKIMTAILCV